MWQLWSVKQTFCNSNPDRCIKLLKLAAGSGYFLTLLMRGLPGGLRLGHQEALGTWAHAVRGDRHSTEAGGGLQVNVPLGSELARPHPQGCSCAGRRWAWARAWRPPHPPTCSRAWWTPASALAPLLTCLGASTWDPCWACSLRRRSSRPLGGRRCGLPVHCAPRTRSAVTDSAWLGICPWAQIN